MLPIQRLSSSGEKVSCFESLMERVEVLHRGEQAPVAPEMPVRTVLRPRPVEGTPEILIPIVPVGEDAFV